MMSRTILSLGCLLCLSSTAWSIRCYECDRLSKPSDCDKVTDCAHDSECFIEAVVTYGGLIHFNTGCRAYGRCLKRDTDINMLNITETIINGVEEAEDETTVCSSCCSNEYCNHHGCGHPEVDRTQRGPICYDCPVQQDRDSCRTVVQCDTYMKCAMQNFTFKPEFKTGCIQTQQCDAIQHLYNDALGKRHTDVTGNDVIKKRQYTDEHPVCCSDDYCNLDLHANNNQQHQQIQHNQYQHQRVDGHWSAWTRWTSCTDTCGPSAVKLRARKCTNPAPSNGGHQCWGQAQQTHRCFVPSC